MHGQNSRFAAEEIEIAEHRWLAVSFIWVILGALAAGPFGSAAKVGRMLFWFTLTVHSVEALYGALRARKGGLGAWKWFLRTIVLGLFALLVLERHLRDLSALRPSR
jgi:uncharacterized protein YhhL (DUF1145 family)